MKKKPLIGGAAAGFANGLLGSGGGMLAVPALTNAGLGRKQAHCTALAVMLPLSAVSTAMYMISGELRFADSLPYLPGGVLGAILGGMLMKRISPNLLRRIFGGFAIWAGIRLLLR